MNIKGKRNNFSLFKKVSLVYAEVLCFLFQRYWPKQVGNECKIYIKVWLVLKHFSITSIGIVLFLSRKYVFEY